MPLWETPPPTAQPAITLVAWRVFEVDGDSQHMVGWCVENSEGRVSTEVESWDIDARAATTRSGRTYRLEGPPGENADALYVWSWWCEVHDVTEVRDLSAATYEACTGSAGDV